MPVPTPAIRRSRRAPCRDRRSIRGRPQRAAERRDDAREVVVHRAVFRRARTDGDAAIDVSVESSPPKYASIIVPARMTRARASLVALWRASSYWWSASPPATKTSARPATRAPSSTRRRNGRPLSKASSRRRAERCAPRWSRILTRLLPGRSNVDAVAAPARNVTRRAARSRRTRRISAEPSRPVVTLRTVAPTRTTTVSRPTAVPARLARTRSVKGRPGVKRTTCGASRRSAVLAVAAVAGGTGTPPGSTDPLPLAASCSATVAVSAMSS